MITKIALLLLVVASVHSYNIKKEAFLQELKGIAERTYKSTEYQIKDYISRMENEVDNNKRKSKIYAGSRHVDRKFAPLEASVHRYEDTLLQDLTSQKSQWDQQANQFYANLRGYSEYELSQYIRYYTSLFESTVRDSSSHLKNSAYSAYRTVSLYASRMFKNIRDYPYY